VHQDGLVHISQLTNKFIKDPREVVRTGDVVKVRVEEVDVQRKRIALTMRLEPTETKESAPRPERAEQSAVQKHQQKFGQREDRRPQPSSRPEHDRRSDTQKPNVKKPVKEALPAANSAMGDLAAALAKMRK